MLPPLSVAVQTIVCRPLLSDSVLIVRNPTAPLEFARPGKSVAMSLR